MPRRKTSDMEVKRNPIRSAEQFGLMEAVSKGYANVKGLSQAVADEMLRKTPRKLKSKFAKELAKHRNRSRNPEDDLRIAEEISEQWHGRKAREVTEVDEIEKYGDTLAELAELMELGVLGSDFTNQYTIAFKKDRPKLCSDLKSDNLLIVGGDQRLEFDAEFVAGKQLVPVGFTYCIAYETDKHHLEGSNGYPEPYEHFFGEEFYKEQGYNQDDYETSEEFFAELLEEGVVEEAIAEGYLPMMVYDTVNEKISLVGGRYKIEDVGIVD